MTTYWENSCSFGLRYVSWYKYLIVSLVFSHLGFWSGNLFLIAPFADLCLLVPFYIARVTPLYDLCPYTNYCSNNATRNLQDDTETPCCGFCSCADNCWKHGNCCADKQNIIVRQPLESCVEITGQNWSHGTPRNLPRYNVIQNCPTLCAACHGVVNYTKWQIATDCLIPLDGGTSLMDAFNNVINTCTLFNNSPGNTDELSNRCFVPDFSTCNETFK